MDKMLQYLKDNPQYVTALIITAAVIILACILGYFVKKYNLLKFSDNWFKKKASDSGQSEKEPTGKPTPKQDDGEIIFEDPAVAFADLATKDSEATDEQAPSQKEDELSGANECEEIPQKKSKLSEMLEKSLQQEVAEEYEEEKKRSSHTAKPTPVIAEEKVETPPISHENEDFEGKWRIMHTGNTFVAELHSEDEVLLIRSQRYSAFSDAKQSIETLKKNIEGNNFTVAVNKKGEFYFKLFSPSGRLICCGEPCKTNDDCKLAIETVKRIAFKAEVVRG